MPLNLSQLRSDLENVVQSRTGRRVLNLDIDLQPERVVLHGRAVSYYVKQLAQEGVERDHRRLLTAALLRLVHARHRRRDAAARRERPDHLAPPRLARLDEVGQQPIHHVLVEDALVTEAL